MFYTYLWLREDGTPYYAGKGTEGRGFTSHGHKVKRPVDSKLIIVQYWDSEAEAFEAEKFLIAYYGRANNNAGCLRNLSDGGEGPSGFKHKNRKGHRDSEETRRKKSESRKGIKYSEETLKKMRESHLGIKRSAESCRKNGIAHKGRKKSEEWKKKIGEANREVWRLKSLKAAKAEEKSNV